MKKENFFVIAHNIRSLHNVGSIFRTADCFGVDKIFLTGYTGTPPDPKISKTALGAEKTVPWDKQKSATRAIKRLKLAFPNLSLVGLENNLPKPLRNKRVSLNKYKPKFPLALLLGHETIGIPKPLLRLCNTLVEIPQYGHKESLNVSVAFGIAAYQVSKGIFDM